MSKASRRNDPRYCRGCKRLKGQCVPKCNVSYTDWARDTARYTARMRRWQTIYREMKHGEHRVARNNQALNDPLDADWGFDYTHREAHGVDWILWLLMEPDPPGPEPVQVPLHSVDG